MSDVKVYTPEQLRAVLESHQLWRSDDPAGVRANLYGANLRSAGLRGANLRSAGLRGANLRSADLRSANLYGAELPAFALVPDEGVFVAFKKAHAERDTLIVSCLVKLTVPADAERVSSLVGRKCRVSKAVVESITYVDTGKPAPRATSMHNLNFKYVVGDTITPDEAFDSDIRVECTSGIHCFITRKEAVDYGS